MSWLRLSFRSLSSEEDASSTTTINELTTTVVVLFSSSSAEDPLAATAGADDDDVDNDKDSNRNQVQPPQRVGDGRWPRLRATLTTVDDDDDDDSHATNQKKNDDNGRTSAESSSSTTAALTYKSSLLSIHPDLHHFLTGASNYKKTDVVDSNDDDDDDTLGREEEEEEGGDEQARRMMRRRRRRTGGGEWFAEPILTRHIIDLIPGRSSSCTVRLRVIHRYYHHHHDDDRIHNNNQNDDDDPRRRRSWLTETHQQGVAHDDNGCGWLLLQPRTVLYDTMHKAIVLVREIVIRRTSADADDDDNAAVVVVPVGCCVRIRFKNDDYDAINAIHVVMDPADGDGESVQEEEDRDGGVPTTTSRSSSFSCPGYEALLEQLLQSIQMPNSLLRPTGIFVHGGPGVGKTRLLKCLSRSLLLLSPRRRRGSGSGEKSGAAQQEQQRPGRRCYYDLWSISRRNFAQQMTTTTLPPLANHNNDDDDVVRLLLIDDLDLILKDGEHNLTTLEMVLNNHNNNNSSSTSSSSPSFMIIAFGNELPPASILTVGRLEVVVEMLPPTQWQREVMLKYFLLLRNSSLSSSSREQRRGNNNNKCHADPTAVARMIPNLARLTAGCVAADLVQWHRIVCSGSIGGGGGSSGNSGDDETNINPTTTMYERYAEAAYALVPSQWAALDVQKPALLSLSSLSAMDDDDKAIFHEAFRPLAGYETIKERLFRAVVLPWRRKQQQRHEQCGMVDAPAGVLFHGPSGCGKTLAATLLGTALGLAMITVRATDVLDQWVGGSEQVVRTMFARARQAAPCILFLDEIDGLAANRGGGFGDDEQGGGGGGGVMSRILSTLLNEMDGVSSSSSSGGGVLIVACTNRLEAIDSALLRPGRLEVHILLGLPSATDIAAMVRQKLQSTVLEETADLSTLAEQMVAVQSSGADVYGWCREAVYQSLRRTKIKPVVVTAHDLEAALVQQLGVSIGA